jgi:uncharacterized protein with PQ loop repeat
MLNANLTPSNDPVLWIFIGIGFIGTITLTISAIFNMCKCVKTKSYDHIEIRVQLLMMVANLCFIIYALGISLVNDSSTIFWNSTPTWAGNLVPFILNLIMVIGKMKANRKHKK